MSEDDSILIKKVLRGEQKMFEVLVKRYQNYVFTIVLKILKSREEAEEVAQDVFVKAYKTLSSFKGNSKFSTWLYTIAYRTAIDQTRKKKINTNSIDQEDQVMQIADVYELSPIAKTQRNDLRSLLQQQINLLKKEDAAVLSLHYLQEKSVKEVAEITGLSLSNVKVKLFRSREKLKQQLSHYLRKELGDFI